MSIKLKIKIKSLAAESRIIRHEERKLTRSHALPHEQTILIIDPKLRPRGKVERLGMIPWARTHQVSAAEIEVMESQYNSLRHHRVVEVRNEARAAQLAYGYLRGKPYAKVEDPEGRRPPLSTIANAVGMVRRFSPGVLSPAVASDSFLAWLQPPGEVQPT